jgi:4-amino-4-deoxy-L-arabinose transferase-like glycosyltransferase
MTQQRLKEKALIAQRLGWVLVFLCVIRLITMVVFPLTDTTEARYAEIARKMLETANWVTPWYDYGIPFWAKPPLSTWISAWSMGLFGVNAFAARLPSFLLILGVLGWVASMGTQQAHRRPAVFAVALLASFPLFFFTAGAVMTEAALLFSTTLSFVSFWKAYIQTDHPYWGYLFFVGLGLGLLAKGPVALVLTGIPIVLWFLTDREVRLWFLWQRLPWIKGVVVMLVIALPWYLLAEYRTPGFLHYFIVGEHIQRFLVSGWVGDRYGHAHVEPLGMIWSFWLLDAFPWAILAVGLVLRAPKQMRAFLLAPGGWHLYLFWWTVSPLLFFTFAHNIILTYTLTGLPAFALLIEQGLYQTDRLNLGIRIVQIFSVVMGIGFLAFSLLLGAVPKSALKGTQLFLVQEYLKKRETKDAQLYYFYFRYYSAEFYSQGRAKTTDSIDVLRGLLHNQTRDFIAIWERHLSLLPEDLMRHFDRVSQIEEMILLEEKDEHG